MILIELGLRERIRTSGWDKAHIIRENDLGGHYFINANFYDAEGIIVKTLKRKAMKTRYNLEDDHFCDLGEETRKYLILVNLIRRK